MPQTNLYTYLSQCTWTIILFFIFYYIMKQYFLPLIFENIKLKSLIKGNVTSSLPHQKLSSKFFYQYNNHISKF